MDDSASSLSKKSSSSSRCSSPDPLRVESSPLVPEEDDEFSDDYSASKPHSPKPKCQSSTPPPTDPDQKSDISEDIPQESAQSQQEQSDNPSDLMTDLFSLLRIGCAQKASVTQEHLISIRQQNDESDQKSATANVVAFSPDFFSQMNQEYSAFLMNAVDFFLTEKANSFYTKYASGSPLEKRPNKHSGGTKAKIDKERETGWRGGWSYNSRQSHTKLTDLDLAETEWSQQKKREHVQKLSEEIRTDNLQREQKLKEKAQTRRKRERASILRSKEMTLDWFLKYPQKLKAKSKKPLVLSGGPIFVSSDPESNQSPSKSPQKAPNVPGLCSVVSVERRPLKPE